MYLPINAFHICDLLILGDIVHKYDSMYILALIEFYVARVNKSV